MAGILFVHNNFPGQFGFLAEALRRRGEQVVAIGSRTAKRVSDIPVLTWSPARGTADGILPSATRAEADLIRGEAAANVALALRARGFAPDLIIGHPGWGETLFLKEIWPQAKIILYAEFYYHARGYDVGFDPESGLPDWAETTRVAAKNATLALAYAEADCLVAPTEFQASALPESLRARTRIIHEGVDLKRIRPGRHAQVRINGRLVGEGRPVITFVNRVFEPMRGCHIFFRALPEILRQLPEAEVVLVGRADGKGYGARPPDGKTWKDVFWAEIADRVDASRLHFSGWLPQDTLNALTGLASAHVYLTYPFVLSWSLLEAMAAEALVVGSDTGPVRDVIRPGENGFLVDFHDHQALAARVVDCVGQGAALDRMRSEARRTVLSRFDRETICLPRWLRLIDMVRRRSGRFSPENMQSIQ